MNNLFIKNKNFITIPNLLLFIITDYSKNNNLNLKLFENFYLVYAIINTVNIWKFKEYPYYRLKIKFHKIKLPSNFPKWSCETNSPILKSKML